MSEVLLMDMPCTREQLEQVVCDASKVLLSYFGSPLTKMPKERGSFATEADLATEAFLIKHLQELVPGSALYAEESGISGDGDYCWVIDPLDGTTNFAHGLPYFCISVALTYKGSPVMAVIYQPITDELFYAQKDAGAYCNNQPIQVSATSDFGTSLLAIGIPYRKTKQMADFDMAKRIIDKCYSLRHFGAIALDCAYIAAGRLDGLVDMGSAWWDVAAGMLLIQEAGGSMTGFDGALINSDSKKKIAGAPIIYKELQKLVK